jgi:hypothetical protein
MNNPIIYITTNLINGKKYIGRDSNNNPNYLGSGIAIAKAIKKYGKNNFIKETLVQTDNVDIINELEEYYIDYYNAYENPMFYNLTKSSSGVHKGIKLNNKKGDVKDRISKSMIGKNIWSKGGYTSKPVYQFDLNGNKINEYPSVHFAKRQTHITTIDNSVLGKTHTSGGFIWIYKDEFSPELLTYRMKMASTRKSLGWTQKR